MKGLILIACIFISSIIIAQPAGYSFGKQVLILSSQVAGTTDHLNFPVLVSFADGDLSHVSNGGNVENINGYDIIFTTSDCSTQLDHEIESYNPITGQYVAWIKIPSLSPTTDFNILMYYGNSSVTTNPSVSSTWSAGYDGVWHLHNDFLDASGNGNNGTNNGSNDLSPAKIADGQNFVDPNNWIELPNHPNKTTSFSYSGWFRTSDRTRTGQRIICDDETNGNGCHAISLGDPGAGRIRFYIRGLGGTSLDSPTLINDNTWYYFTATYNTVTQFKTIYVNGSLVASSTESGTLNAAVGNASIGGETASGETGNRFQGDLDEIRSFNGVHSADWITTSYNNQNNPTSFYTVSLQYTAAILCGTLPIELIDFSATLQLKNSVRLSWRTAAEINNDYFTIERSKDAINWEIINQINGAGNSSEINEYTVIDDNPYSGTTYYRLKQTDFNGSFSYSLIRSITTNAIDNNQLIIYPNPVLALITISGNRNELTQLQLFNLLGQDITSKASLISSTPTQLTIDLSNLGNGIYIIKTATKTSKISKQ